MVARLVEPLGLHRYAPVLRTPGAVALLLSTLLARAGQFGSGLALLLAAESASGSFGVAGTASGLLAAGLALSRVVQGRLLDRVGATRVLLASSGLLALALAGLLLVLVDWRGPLPLLGLSAVVGMTLPDVGTVARIALGSLAAGSTERKTSAYALETLTSELAAIVGPAGAAVVATTVSPVLALAGTAAMMVAGAVVVACGRAAGEVRGRRRARGPRGGLARALRLPLAVTFGIGLAFGAVEVALPAFAIDSGSPSAAGVSARARGRSALGGPVVRRAAWRARCETRLLVASALFSVGCALFPLMPSPLAMAALLPLVGAPIPPALTTLYLQIDERVHERIGEGSPG